MKLDNLVLYRGKEFSPNFFYFAGCDVDHGFFVSSKGKKTLLVPKMNEAIARKEFKGSVKTYGKPFDDLKKLMRAKKISLDYASISASLFLSLRKKFKAEDVSEQLEVARMMKKGEEIAKVAKAAKISKEILHSIDFKKCRTENDVKKFLLKETLKRGVEPAYAPIVATDKNSAFPHYTPANVKLGSVVLIDYAVKYERYCSDITRCYFLDNSSMAKEAKKNYEKLQDVFHGIIDNMPSFQTGGKLAKFAATSMEKHGLPKMIHGIGHGVGLEIHELPRLSEKFKDKLKQTTLAIEPAVYFNGKYGLRFEETVYFDGKRARIL